MNGAMLYWPQPNIEYVEGYALDEFAAERIALQPLPEGGHRIGLLLDRAMDEGSRRRHLQVADAARATLGINVAHCVVTKEPVGVTTDLTAAGASWGNVRNPATLLAAGRALRDRGCTAIAVVCRFPEDDELAAMRFASYRAGQGVDQLGGAEALISRLLTKHLMLPCAHAPAFDHPVQLDHAVAPKACAEELGHSFLPCVLANLHRAPLLHPLHQQQRGARGWLTADSVRAVVAPSSALGGPAVLALLARGKLVVAVTDNASAMRMSSEQLPARYAGQVLCARSYAEAAGMIAADRLGVLQASTTSEVPPLAVEEEEDCSSSSSSS